MKVWDNGTFTDNANMIMFMSAWVLSWVGFVVGTIIQGVCMDNDLLLQDAVLLYEINLLSTRLLNRIETYNKRHTVESSCLYKLELLVLAIQFICTKENSSKPYPAGMIDKAREIVEVKYG